ncbi:MAG: hypothetical protein IMY74_09120 [Bacteroidetes bacterium]|nr:hypothetical protein [Bacteroidota bacterium]
MPKIALVGLIACACLASVGYAQGTLGGSNAVTVTITDPANAFSIDIRDVFNVSYRLDNFSLSGRTTFTTTAPPTQDFRLSAHVGDLAVQGATSFRTDAFTRGNLDLSGSWEGVSYRASFLISNLGSSETPSYDTGSVFRIAGVAAGLGYVSIAAGVGASPFGSVREGACFEGARILLSDLSLCGGKAAVDLLLGLAGPDTETITWQTTLAYHDLKLQTSLRFIDLFQFQGVAANMRVTIGGLLITGRFSFDSDLVFQSGNWSITAPLFGGSLTSATTFNATTLVSQNLTWSYWGDQLFVVITPMFDIVSFDGAMLEFAVPAIRVNLRWVLGCCDGPELGDLGLVIRATKEKFESIAVTYTYSF